MLHKSRPKPLLLPSHLLGILMQFSLLQVARLNNIAVFMQLGSITVSTVPSALLVGCSAMNEGHAIATYRPYPITPAQHSTTQYQ